MLLHAAGWCRFDQLQPWPGSPSKTLIGDVHRLLTGERYRERQGKRQTKRSSRRKGERARAGERATQLGSDNIRGKEEESEQRREAEKRDRIIKTTVSCSQQDGSCELSMRVCVFKHTPEESFDSMVLV